MTFAGESQSGRTASGYVADEIYIAVARWHVDAAGGGVDRRIGVVEDAGVGRPDRGAADAVKGMSQPMRPDEITSTCDPVSSEGGVCQDARQGRVGVPGENQGMPVSVQAFGRLS